MNIKHIWKISLLAVLLVLTACARKEPDTYVIDHGGIRLLIPKQYLLQPGGWWSNLDKKANGLDTSEHSVNLEIPVTEVNSWLPAQADKFHQTLGVLLWVYDKQEMDKGQAARIEQVQDYIVGKGMYGSLTVEPDKVPGWFRIYDGANWKTTWRVATHSAQDIKKSGTITGDEILGTCVDQKAAGVICSVYLLEKPGFLLQIDLNENQLPYYEPIRDGMMKLLAQWQQ